MKTTQTTCLVALALCLSISGLISQSVSERFWNDSVHKSLTENNVDALMDEAPISYKLYDVDFENLQKYLQSAPKLIDPHVSTELVVSLPNTVGGIQNFNVLENNCIDPSVAHLYTIKTYQGVSVDNPSVQVRLDISDIGFHAYIFDGSQSYIIEPADRNNRTTHIVYEKSEIASGVHSCTALKPPTRLVTEAQTSARSTMLRNYRIAMVAAGEYSEQYGGNPCNKTTVLNSMASGLNMINAIYNKDLGVQLNIISNTDLVFCDSTTDPYDPSGDQVALVAQNQTECDNALTNNGYDVGHLLVWANTGGIAYTGVICYTGFKAQGFSGSSSSFSTLFVDYAAHEIGHQFNGSHNFVSDECENSEDNYRYEPGEGSSLMAYAGVCGAAPSYQSSSDPFFHSASLDDMNGYIDMWGGCATLTSPGSGNASAPVADAKQNIVIPKETPFILVGSAVDANDSAISYLWEQFDGTSVAVSGSPDCNTGTAPLFKFQEPELLPFRIFPDISNVLVGNNANVTWEKLPCTARTMNFRLVARDNNPNWGRVDHDAMTVQVMNTGPFSVVSPNGGETYGQGELVDVTWVVNNTDTHCPSVDVLISVDGGQTYTVLASNVNNDGSQSVNMPNTMNSTSRILIQCSTNTSAFGVSSTFFDVSDGNFSLSATLPVRLNFFDAYANEKTIDLTWMTSQEEDMKEYQVEKSLEGVNFVKIGAVVAKDGISNDYAYIDINPQSGIQYYRLKQMDMDGRYTYSKTVSVRYGSHEDRVFIYPNPSSNMINIGGFLSNDPIEVVLYNASGEQVKQIIINTTEPLDIEELATGVYFMDMKQGNLNIRRKFFKI